MDQNAKAKPAVAPCPDGRRTMPSSMWSRMPPEVMTRVFDRLPEKDRANARRVCKSWDRVYNVSQLWRKKTVTFTGSTQDEGARAARYMETFGSQLRNLRIEIGLTDAQLQSLPTRPTLRFNAYSRLARNISQSLEAFLKARPRGMRLRSFACYGLGFFERNSYRIAHADRHAQRISRALYFFLRNQKCLERVDLTGCEVDIQEGTRILKALAYCDRRSRTGTTPKTDEPSSCLTHLDLRDFFRYGTNEAGCPALLENVNFTALRTLGLNFTYLSDSVLAGLTRNCPNLERLVLSTSNYKVPRVLRMAKNDRMVTTAGWTAACRRCPNLRVEADMKELYGMVDFRLVLKPGMPLSVLSITFLASLRTDRMLAHIDRLVGFLGQQFSGTLKALHVGRWNGSRVRWADEDSMVVVRLVKSCPCLRLLSLPVTVPFRTVRQLASAFLLRPGPLHVYVAGLEPYDDALDVVQSKVSTVQVLCEVHVGEEPSLGLNPCLGSSVQV